MIFLLKKYNVERIKNQFNLSPMLIKSKCVDWVIKNLIINFDYWFIFSKKIANNSKTNANNALLPTSSIDIPMFEKFWTKNFGPIILNLGSILVGLGGHELGSWDLATWAWGFGNKWRAILSIALMYFTYWPDMHNVIK